jgi:hypothetical protein
MSWSEHLSTLASSPAFWSAAAATGSFFTAVLVWSVQRRNLIESVRPELVLDDWDRPSSSAAGIEEIAFRRIENVGRGAAFAVAVHCKYQSIETMAPFMPTMHISVIKSGAEKEVNGTISIHWFRLKNDLGLIGVPLEISYWDSLGNRYVTFHRVDVSAQIPLLGAEAVAQDVVTSWRYTKRQRLLWMRIVAPIKRLRRLVWARLTSMFRRKSHTQR